MHCAYRIACLGIIASLAATVAAAESSWPQWRGPDRDGSLAPALLPETWPESVIRRWEIEVGEGHASPVVFGEKAFVFTRQGEDEIVRAIRVADGSEIWSGRYSAEYEMHSAATRHGKGPKSTPAVSEGRLFTFGISGTLTAWDTVSGRRLWQRRFEEEFPTTSPLYGAAASPLVVEQRVIVPIGGHDRGALAAFDPATGRTLWQWEGDGPAYTSPIVLGEGTARHLVTQSQNATAGFDIESGRLLWQFPFRTPFDQNIVTPLDVDDLVIFSGLNQGATAYRLVGGDEGWQAEEVWHNNEASMYMSSPVSVGGRLLGLSHRGRGRFFCLEAATGKTLFSSRGRHGENAALLAGEDAVLALTTDGELIVFDPYAEQFTELVRYRVAEKPTWAHPAMIPGGMLIKDADTVALWTWE